MRQRKYRLWLFGLLLFIPLTACESILSPDSTRIPGILGMGAEAVEVPETARVGEPVTVRIETGFSNGCSKKGETWVTREGTLVTMRPFDFLTNLSGRNVCLLEVVRFNHDVTLEFDHPGVFTIRVVGSQGREGGTRVIEREIEVEPAESTM